MPGGYSAAAPAAAASSGCLKAAVAAAWAKYREQARGCSATAKVYTKAGPVCRQVVAGTNYAFNFVIKCGRGAATPKHFQAECFQPLTSSKPKAVKVSSVVLGTA